MLQSNVFDNLPDPSERDRVNGSANSVFPHPISIYLLFDEGISDTGFGWDDSNGASLLPYILQI